MIIVWLDRKYCIFQTDTLNVSNSLQFEQFFNVIFEAMIPPTEC